MPDYPRCRTCKWWNTTGISDAGSCSLTHTTEPGSPMLIENDALIVSSDRLVRLLTSPDFGCTRHEPKDGA